MIVVEYMDVNWKWIESWETRIETLGWLNMIWGDLWDGDVRREHGLLYSYVVAVCVWLLKSFVNV